MGYLCANFGLPIGLSVLDLGPMYATDRRQTDVRMTDRRQAKTSLHASAYIIIMQFNEFEDHYISLAHVRAFTFVLSRVLAK